MPVLAAAERDEAVDGRRVRFPAETARSGFVQRWKSQWAVFTTATLLPVVAASSPALLSELPKPFRSGM